MTNIAVFEKVASGQYTAEQGAKLMLDSDEVARDAGKPGWMPKYAWAAVNITICLALSVLSEKARQGTGQLATLQKNPI